MPNTRTRLQVLACLRFVDRVYAALGFQYAAHLSTRPASFVGEVATWDHAEACLINALEAAGLPWSTNEVVHGRTEWVYGRMVMGRMGARCLLV